MNFPKLKIINKSLQFNIKLQAFLHQLFNIRNIFSLKWENKRKGAELINMGTNKKLPNESTKEYTKYLSASDIVNSAGGSYIITEPEMESAFKELMTEIDEN